MKVSHLILCVCVYFGDMLRESRVRLRSRKGGVDRYSSFGYFNFMCQVLNLITFSMGL